MEMLFISFVILGSFSTLLFFIIVSVICIIDILRENKEGGLC